MPRRRAAEHRSLTAPHVPNTSRSGQVQDRLYGCYGQCETTVRLAFMLKAPKALVIYNCSNRVLSSFLGELTGSAKFHN